MLLTYPTVPQQQLLALTDELLKVRQTVESEILRALGIIEVGGFQTSRYLALAKRNI